MKERTLLLCGVAFILLFGSYSEAQGSDWIFIGRDGKKNAYYYDKDSLNYEKKGNDKFVSTWTKNQYSQIGWMTDKAVPEKLRDLFITPGHRLDFEYYNCSQKKFRSIEVIVYDEKGEVVRSANFDSEPSWSVIAPDSVAEMIRDTVCAVGIPKKKK